jgi:hypothetical protein
VWEAQALGAANFKSHEMESIVDVVEALRAIREHDVVEGGRRRKAALLNLKSNPVSLALGHL